MKANAPEKIYLTSDEKNSYVFTQKRSDGIGIEYIRTDTIIEKACEWFKSHGSFTIGFDGATVRDFLNFINK